MAILVGDIGGTSSRFGFAHDPADPAAVTGISVLDNVEHTGLGEAANSYLVSAPERPTFAVMAIAGPVTEAVVRLTNLDWRFSAASLSGEIGCPTLVINDFEALACALPYIRSNELRLIGTGDVLPDATKAVLGPGTGLGVAALARWNGRWIPIPSEGGHAELAGSTPEERALFDIIRRSQGRVSAEDILSGRGFARLHLARAALHGYACDPSISPPALTAAALAGEPQAVKTARALLRILGGYAGDIALMFAATGGVYLHGGVTLKLSPLLQPEVFRAAFEAKEPHRAFLEKIGSCYIADPTPALIGCAALAFDRFRLI